MQKSAFIQMNEENKNKKKHRDIELARTSDSHRRPNGVGPVPSLKMMYVLMLCTVHAKWMETNFRRLQLINKMLKRCFKTIIREDEPIRIFSLKIAIHININLSVFRKDHKIYGEHFVFSFLKSAGVEHFCFLLFIAFCSIRIQLHVPWADKIEVHYCTLFSMFKGDRKVRRL